MGSRIIEYCIDNDFSMQVIDIDTRVGILSELIDEFDITGTWGEE